MTNENKWEKELKTLEHGELTEFFKPEEGKTEIVFKDEGTQRFFEWEGAQIEKVDFRIEVQGKPYVWSITKSKTISSLYGQVVALAVSKGGLINQKINLLTKGMKMQRTYLILESLDLIKKVKKENIK